MKTSTLRTPTATLAATSLSSGLSTIAPGRSREAGNVRKIALSKMVCIVSVFCVATAIISPGQTKFTSLFSFEGTNGADPHYVDLVQGIDGELYGTTYSGTGDGGK
ncbi:MAG: hypothetical protein WBC78_24075, partial [Candidatus Sulfotelmatobacter sp.]